MTFPPSTKRRWSRGRSGRFVRLVDSVSFFHGDFRSHERETEPEERGEAWQSFHKNVDLCQTDRLQQRRSLKLDHSVCCFGLTFLEQPTLNLSTASLDLLQK